MLFTLLYMHKHNSTFYCSSVTLNPLFASSLKVTVAATEHTFVSLSLSLSVSETTMVCERGKKKKKIPAATGTNVVSWQEKRILADEEEKALQKDLEEIQIWTTMIDKMDDQQLKNYVQNKPDNLKLLEKAKPRRRVQKTGKEKSTASYRIMASVWKFHKEDDDEGPSTKSNV